MFCSLTLLFNVTLSTQTARSQHQFHTLSPHKCMAHEHITPTGTPTIQQKKENEKYQVHLLFNTA
jgi:hypothetical protein